MSKYLVKDFQEGWHEFDTLYVEVDKEIYQVPISKELEGFKLRGKTIEIKNLFQPIENIETEIKK